MGAEFSVVIFNAGSTSTVPVGKSSGKISAGMLACNELLLDDELTSEEIADAELKLELLLTELEDTAGNELFEPELPPPHAVSETKHKQATNRINTDMESLPFIII